MNHLKQITGIPLPIPTEKRCNTCPETGMQPMSAFSRVPCNSDGHSNKCRKCQREDTKQRLAAKKAERELYGY